MKPVAFVAHQGEIPGRAVAPSILIMFSLGHLSSVGHEAAPESSALVLARDTLGLTPTEDASIRVEMKGKVGCKGRTSFLAKITK